MDTLLKTLEDSCLPSVRKLVDLSGVSRATLYRWHTDNTEAFEVVLGKAEKDYLAEVASKYHGAAA